MTRKLIVTCLSITALGSGCGDRLFSDRATNPVVEDYVSRHILKPDYGTLSTSAGRRTILVEFPNTRSPSARLCAEPPPDAIESYANALAVAARASAQAQVPVTASGEFSRGFSTGAAPILYRTQGLQLFRDVQFTLCVMYLNGVISHEAYFTQILAMIPVVKDLIKEEMKAIEIAAAKSATIVQAGQLPSSLIPTAPSPPQSKTPGTEGASGTGTSSPR